jgi:phage replication initiation protein
MNLTKVDWFGFRSKGAIPEVVEAIRGVFDSSLPPMAVRLRKSGWNGFKSSADLFVGDMQVGFMAYGGESQRGNVMVNVTGRGCEWAVPDWAKVQDAVQVLPGYEIRRLDIALDTHHREVTHEKVIDAYRDGLFTLAGRPPSMTRIEPEDPLEGSTIYIGKRENSKFLRCYQKGLELVRGYPRGAIRMLDGVPVQDIYRVELELKAKDGPLPVDLIDKRDQYFAGAYPYLQTLVDVRPEVFVQSREKGPQHDLEGMLAHIRQQYGSTLFTALMAHQGDIGAVWSKIVGHKHNADLLAAGVLLVDHH